VTEIAANPVYLDVFVPAQTIFTSRSSGHTAFAIFEGEVRFAGHDGAAGEKISSPKLIILGDGDEVKVMTGIAPARFLVVSGKPLGEPIARYGPFVMNTEEEIEQTLEELRRGTFVTK
jgi:redox-sensitive bicupin YhaK (pirin superfamily)